MHPATEKPGPALQQLLKAEAGDSQKTTDLLVSNHSEFTSISILRIVSWYANPHTRIMINIMSANLQ